MSRKKEEGVTCRQIVEELKKLALPGENTISYTEAINCIHDCFNRTPEDAKFVLDNLPYTFFHDILKIENKAGLGLKVVFI